MSEFKKYRRKSVSEMRPYKPGEDMKGISVSDAEKKAGSPKIGDMIARNPKNYDDKWLVAKVYFEDNLEEIPSTDTYMDRLIIEKDELTEKYSKLETALTTRAVPEGARDVLKRQLAAMALYLEILIERIGL